MTKTKLLLIGAVTTGMGDAKKFLSLTGYIDQFKSLLGYEPFPGTLNVTLNTHSIEIKSNMDHMVPIVIKSWTDTDKTYGSVDCYPATIIKPKGEEVIPLHAIFPKRTHHGVEKLELLSPVNLRIILSLLDNVDLHISIHTYLI